MDQELFHAKNFEIWTKVKELISMGQLLMNSVYLITGN